MSDASGYLPPHELRSLAALEPRGPVGNAASREGAESGRVPGPAAALGSPGLATAAASGSPLAPTFAMDDPSTLALGISRVVEEQFGASTMSVVPMPAPDSLASGVGASVPASPGVAAIPTGVPNELAIGPGGMTAVPDDAALIANLSRVIDAQLAASVVPWPAAEVASGTNVAPPGSPGLATAAPSGVPSFATPAGASDVALPPDVETAVAAGVGSPTNAAGVGSPTSGANATNAAGAGLPTSAANAGSPTSGANATNAAGVGSPTSGANATNAAGAGLPTSIATMHSLPIRSFEDVAARVDLANTPGIAPQLAPVGSHLAYEPTIGAAPASAAMHSTPRTAPDSSSSGAAMHSTPRTAPDSSGSGASSFAVPGASSLRTPGADSLRTPAATPPPTGVIAPVRIGALDELGGVTHVPFADIPVLDQLAASAPPMGGTQAWQSPPHAGGFDHGADAGGFDHAPALDALANAGALDALANAGAVDGVVVPSWPAGEHVPFVETRRLEAHESPVRQHGGVAFDPYRVRRDFPILDERVHGKRLVWLDNAATTQKPRSVIDRLTYYYEHENSNVHRGAHAMAARATDAFESARETTRKFLNASAASEIVFVRGATEGINLIAKAYGKRHVERGDEIVVTHLEHHANIVPWQQLCAETGARLRVAPVDDRGDVILDEYEKLLCSRTKIVAFTQVSNALGTITPAREMIEIAHRWGATVVLDGAQAVSHMAVDVQELDCDFYVFSGHKVFAPTGIGAVYGKRAVLDAMPPWQGGGNMIHDVTFERTLYQPPPWRFEAGTGNIADAAGMGAALDYVMRIGMTTIDRYEHELLEYATEQLCTVRGLHLIGTARRKAGVLSFILDGQRTEDVGSALDKHGIAVRSGHHCAQPILRRFGLEASVRASLAFYNVREDIDALIRALREIQASV